LPPIRFGGLASGLPPNIVEQIMASERIPIQNMETKKTNINAKLELVGDLETRLRKVGDSMKEIIGTGGFKDYALNFSREGILAGAVDPAQAQTGTWAFEVLKIPKSSGRMTNGFPDRDRTQVGVGYLKFDSSEGSQEVYINDSNNTLDGIARAVNEANVGVKASIISDADDSDYPHKLIFSSSEYGKNNDVSFPTVYLLDGDHDFYFDKEQKAENGKIKVNGFEVEVDTKKLENIVPGVTLDMMSAEPGREVTVNVTENFEAIKGKMDEFVGSINGVLSFIQQQNKLDEKSDTRKTLGGDSMLRSVESRLRSLIQSGSYSTGEGVNRLAQLGVEFNRNGTLDFDKEKFNSTLQSKPKEVVKFLQGDGSRGSGFINKVKDLVQSSVSGGFGIVSNKKSGLQNQIRNIDQRIDNKERLLAQKEVNLRNKFSRLEEQMGRLQSQGGAIASIGAGLGGASGGSIG
jgi:flagellar hook-associated protein 2